MSTILCLGDSITYGYPYGPQSSWVGLAAGETGFNMINRGLNGDTTGGMMARFKRGLTTDDPGLSDIDCIIITGGANDAWMGIDIGEVKHNIKTMVDMSVNNGIIPVVGITVPVNFDSPDYFIDPADVVRVSSLLESYKKWMREYASHRGLPLMDFHYCLADPGTGFGVSIYYADNIHPNRDGYKRMADAAVRQLTEICRRA